MARTRRRRALLTRALELALDVRIPVAVPAETLRGGPRDAPIHRVRNAVDVDALVAAEAIIAAADPTLPGYFFGTGTGMPGIFTLVEPRWLRLVK